MINDYTQPTKKKTLLLNFFQNNSGNSKENET